MVTCKKKALIISKKRKAVNYPVARKGGLV